MFEDITETENRRGFRGFVGRHFGKLFDAEQAASEVEIYAWVFFGIGAIEVISGTLDLVSPDLPPGSESTPIGVIVVGGLTLVLTALVRFFKSRVCAILLALLAILKALPLNLLGYVWAAFSLRLVQACFAYHRFSRHPPPQTGEFD